MLVLLIISVSVKNLCTNNTEISVVENHTLNFLTVEVIYLSVEGIMI